MIWEDSFNKMNMTRNKDFGGYWVKTVKGVMINGVSKKHTWARPRFQFVISVGAKPGIT